MTTKNSVCIKCKHLDAITGAHCITTNGTRSLISICIYGGKNAGNRKTCKMFQRADEINISNRLATLEEGENK